ncbi:uncharacterized protein LOC109833782 isoform X2 [Asparagus officinalis]|uniref:uncharacterized protein LOC109833782 isoform X2 n=1 Tax=Asparagus officinalis TaxID=4686 RepID=UPI00098E29A7|nr:uncharacterized protein LOC109833782 isoform X2 [Asparagus officinalis]
MRDWWSLMHYNLQHVDNLVKPLMKSSKYGMDSLLSIGPAGKGTGLKGEIIALSTGAFCLHPTSAQTDTKTPCGLDLETCFLLATASKMERNELLPQSCSSLSTIVTLTQIFG